MVIRRLSLILLAAVFFGPLGIHDLGHSFDPHHYLEHLQAAGDDCVACALAYSPDMGPTAPTMPPPPAQIAERPVPQRECIDLSRPVSGYGQRAPPAHS